MNITFIRNLSDEILRENHHLKTELIIYKQKLTDFQTKCIDMIKTIYPQLLLLGSPDDTLTNFINAISDTLDNYRKTLTQTAEDQKYIEILTIKIKVTEDKVYSKDLQLKHRQKKINQIKENMTSLEKRQLLETNEMKRLMREAESHFQSFKKQHFLELGELEERRKAEVELVRKKALHEFIQCRQQSQKQIVQLQRQLKEQIGNKNRNLIELERTLGKMTSNERLEDYQNHILNQLLKNFQEYNKVSLDISLLAEENTKLKHRNKESQARIIRLQFKNEELKAKQQNAKGLVKRMQQEYNFMLAKIEKSQADQEAMELYYSTKWNRQFRKVKEHAESSFIAKADLLKDEYNIKLEQIIKQMLDSRKQMEAFQNKNRELSKDNSEINKKHGLMSEQNRLLKIERQSICMAREQMWKMSREELLCIKNYYLERQDQWRKRTIGLQEQIRQKDVQTEQMWIVREDRIRETHQLYERSIAQLGQRHEDAIRQIQRAFATKIQQLQKRINEQEKDVKQIRRQIQKEFIQKERIFRVKLQSDLKEALRQNAEQIQKYVLKMKEVQSKYKALKKKGEEDNEQFSGRLFEMQRVLQQKQHDNERLKVELKKQINLKNEAFIEISSLRAQKQQFKLSLANRENLENDYKKEMTLLDTEMNRLRQQQLSWQDNLRVLQKQLKRDLAELKAIHECQASIAKSKIWELQQMLQRRPTKRKDLQKIHELNRQKVQLQNELCIKEAQNIVLNQVKDYYEIKCREVGQTAEYNSKMNKKESGFFTRKKKEYIKPNPDRYKGLLDESHEVAALKKYIYKSQKKNKMREGENKFLFAPLNHFKRANTTVS